MRLLGKDVDGVTDVSLDNLKKLALQFKKFVRVEIICDEKLGHVSRFIFENDEVYEATGFSIGYGGEGPHGLHKAIRMWCPVEMAEDFWASAISQIDPDKNWAWTPEFGFAPLEEA